jgi:hypothetical protein
MRQNAAPSSNRALRGGDDFSILQPAPRRRNLASGHLDDSPIVVFELKEMAAKDAAKGPNLPFGCILVYQWPNQSGKRW